jgi:hypothetical protein
MEHSHAAFGGEVAEWFNAHAWKVEWGLFPHVHRSALNGHLIQGVDVALLATRTLLDCKAPISRETVSDGSIRYRRSLIASIWPVTRNFSGTPPSVLRCLMAVPDRLCWQSETKHTPHRGAKVPNSTRGPNTPSPCWLGNAGPRAESPGSCGRRELSIWGPGCWTAAAPSHFTTQHADDEGIVWTICDATSRSRIGSGSGCRHILPRTETNRKNMWKRPTPNGSANLCRRRRHRL